MQLKAIAALYVFTAFSLAPLPALHAADAPLNLKKWPKGEPADTYLLKDEKALYKTLADDAARLKFIDFVHARRSYEKVDFRQTEAEIKDYLDKNYAVKAASLSDKGEGKLLYHGWEMPIGKVISGYGFPDREKIDDKNPAIYRLYYERLLADKMPRPLTVEFIVQPQTVMGQTKEVLQITSKLPVPTIWEFILPPAGPAWTDFQAGKPVALVSCVELKAGNCRASAPDATGAAADESVPVTTGVTRFTDAEFATEFAGDGTLSPNVSIMYLPTQVSGDSEARISVAMPGAPYTARAHLLPAAGSGGSEEELTGVPGKDKDGKDVEADFKGVMIGGKYYLEARRSVKAGRYRLALVAQRGAEYGRIIRDITVPRFSDGVLTLAAAIFAAKPERAKLGDPLTLGEYRILPHDGKYKAGDNFTPIFVVNGARKSGSAYNLKAELTFRLEAGAASKADAAKLKFGKGDNIQSINAELNSTTPMLGGEFTVPADPPKGSAMVTTGKGANAKSENIPLRWVKFEVKAKITDLNSGGSIETDWYDLPLEK